MVEQIANPYAEEAQTRWPQQYAESNRRLAKLSKVEQQAVFDQHETIAQKLAVAMQSGMAFDSVAVQALIARHYQWMTNFWTPTAIAYQGLADMYVADARFAANYNKFAYGLADFMRLAMHHYADANLS